jgi:Icc-related predicted phosphoesterase
MDEARRPLTIAALGDLHVAETAVHPCRELLREASEQADVLVLCGDLTNLGTPREAEILAEDLGSCSIPMIAVLGNHDFQSDQPQDVVRILRAAGVLFLEAQVHEIEGVGFAGTKGFAGGFDNRMLSPFGESAIKQFVTEAVNEAARLENNLRALKTERTVVVLHYAPVVGTVEGEPKEIYPFLGNSRLAETIDRFPVSAVLHGHAHQGAYTATTARGIPVYNCALSVKKPSGRPYALIEI